MVAHVSLSAKWADRRGLATAARPHGGGGGRRPTAAARRPRSWLGAPPAAARAHVEMKNHDSSSCVRVGRRHATEKEVGARVARKQGS
jgi:hypothetical protein